MSDEEVKKILTEWSFPNLIETFRFHNIDMNTFENLTIVEITKIIPETSRFQDAFIQKYKSSLIKKARLNVDDENDQENEIEKNRLNGKNNDCLQAKDTSANSSPLLDISNLSEPDAILNSNPNVNEENTRLNEKLKVLEGSFSECKYQLLRLRPLYKLLMQTLTGQIILFHYAETKTVLMKDLSRIVIQESLQATLSNTFGEPFTLSCKQFGTIVDDIFQLFSTEKTRELYYRQGKNTVENNRVRKVKAAGSLVNAYDTLRAKLQSVGLLCPKYQKTQESHEEPIVINLNLDILYSENINNEEEVINTWKYSYSHRHDVLYPGLSFSKLIDTFKILSTDIGPRLIESDFICKTNRFLPTSEHKYKDTELKDKLTYHWKIIAPKIISVAKKERLVRENTKKIRSSCKSDTIAIPDHEIVDVDHVNALAFALLPSLIKYSFQAVIYKNWKPKQTEIDNSFIEFIKSPKEEAELKQLINEKQEYYNSKNITSPQPFIIAVGTVESIQSSYVAVGNFLFKSNSLVEAVDLCFRIFFSFQLSYTIGCAHVWSFIHRYVYELDSSYKPLVALNCIFKLSDQLAKET